MNSGDTNQLNINNFSINTWERRFKNGEGS